MKKLAKKKSAKKTAKKTLSCNDKITRILSKVNEICNYAIENQCTQQAQFEELEWMLNEYVK